MNYLSVDDVATKLKISKRTTLKLFNAPGFPYIKVGAKYIVEENDFDDYLNSHKFTKIDLD